MKIRALIALGACCALGMSGVASAAGGKADTGVTIGGLPDNVHGKVLSERPSCQYNRTVIVFKQIGSKQDPSVDQKVGTDVSERSGTVGRWSIGNPGLKKGTYYAKAKGNSKCAAGFSKSRSTS
jgi:hypothetical protein